MASACDGTPTHYTADYSGAGFPARDPRQDAEQWAATSSVLNRSGARQLLARASAVLEPDEILVFIGGSRDLHLDALVTDGRSQR